ncbi:hypothetical protein [Streptomyces sennicomposti]|uniref:hypothetical protein n=1 Tax=Streptomyces sennicomposti TaxID=2873384 RepID=UPI001CA61022|nr:hypothetical protein [Streptomyces sennicomposti]MBY8867688.1 hypothetical protein [Streptomyces sennicomposti]
MNRTERERVVRRLLAQPRPQVPPGLYADAVRRGERLLRRQALVRRVLWLTLLAAVIALTVWVSAARPWVEPPSRTTPPVRGW